MFGYIIPAKEPLSEPQQARYRATYCGLCRALGQEYGQLSRMLLSYDITFLALLLGQEHAGALETSQIHCPAKLGRRVCACETDARFRHCADVSLILTYWQLRDAVQDDGALKGLPPRAASGLLRRAYHQAAQRLPEFDAITRRALAQLRELELRGEPSLDRTADCFAAILKAAAAPIEDQTRRRVVEQILYHVGRWIYLIDAWDDMEKDKKSGQYNAVIARFGTQAREQEAYFKTTLLHSRNTAYAAFQLSDFGEDAPLIGDVLTDGMRTVEDMVFAGTWKTRRFAHERPI